MWENFYIKSSLSDFEAHMNVKLLELTNSAKDNGMRKKGQEN